jgi:uncharacterized protein
VLEAIITDVIIIIGLIVFEVVNSLDNAIVNANVLKTMSAVWRKRFLWIGIITSVFIVRFILPFLIVWLSAPTLSPMDVLVASFSNDPQAAQIIEAQKPIILMFGGVFLLFLYLHWLFLEKKSPIFIERFVNEKKHGVWFFAFAAIILVLTMYFASANNMMMLAAAVGSAVFFIVYGLKETAEKAETNLKSNSNLSDLSKFLYLEVLDATFSFDGVIGAFAFTTNLLLILIGIGVGALVVRELTIKGIDKVSQYPYLKNGAMTSIGFLGIFMILEAFGVDIPSLVSIIVTIGLILVAFWLSKKKNQKGLTVKPIQDANCEEKV